MSHTVLHIITGLRTGGAEIMLAKLLARLHPHPRIRFIVLSLTEGGNIEEDIRAVGIEVYHLSLKKTYPLRLGRLRRLIDTLAPDLIQGWMIHGNLVALLAARMSGNLPVLWNVRHSLGGEHTHSRTSTLLNHLLRAVSFSPDRILYNSYTSAQQHERFGFAANKTLVIPNGFDCTRFRPDVFARVSVRADLGLSADANLIGLYARCHPMKDHTTFGKAAAEIATQCPSAHFLLAGTGIYSNAEQLMDLAHNPLLFNKVHFLGERSDMTRLNAALDLAVSSSCGGEGFSNAIGEAMACGIPCVVTDVGDSALLLGNAGVVVPPKDPHALAQACLHLLRSGYNVRQGLGAVGRDRVLACFSIERVAKLYEDLYSTMLGCRTPATICAEH